VAHQEGREIRHFTAAVFDLIALTGDPHTQTEKSNPQYYFRPWKTLLVRTVQDGGESFYIQADHRSSMPTVRALVIERLERAP